jgi:hypothetical protein
VDMPGLYSGSGPLPDTPPQERQCTALKRFDLNAWWWYTSFVTDQLRLPALSAAAVAQEGVRSLRRGKEFSP